MREIKKVIPRAVALRHEDIFTAGIPDLSLSLNGKTSWWEVKIASPYCKSKAVQKHICQRLDATSYCRYVIYCLENSSGRSRQIRIVPPLEFDSWATAGVVVSHDTFDQGRGVRYMAQAHGVVA